MTDEPVVTEETSPGPRAKLAQATVALLYVGALAVYAVALVLAVQTARRPFLGAFVEPTLVVNNVGENEWNGRSAGLDLPDHLTELDGQPLAGPRSLYNRLAHYQAGDLVTLTVEQPDGVRRQVQVALQDFPAAAFIAFFVVPYSIGLTYLLIGLVVFVARRDRAAGRAFPVFCVAFALVSATLLDLYTTHRLMYMWVVGLAVIGGSMIDLALVFPRRSSLARRWPWLPRLVYLPSVATGAWALLTTTDMGNPWAYIPAWRPLYSYAALGTILWVTMLLRRRQQAESPMVRAQSRTILLGLLVACIPIVIWFLLASLQVGLNFYPTLMLTPLILLPLSIAYAILRYRLLDVDRLISRSVSYGLLTLVVVGGYLLVLNLLSLMVGTAIKASNPWVVGFFVFVMILVLHPLRMRMQQAVDQLFFRDRTDYRQELEAYIHDVGRLLNQTDIFNALSRRIEAAVHPQRLLFYLYDESALQFAPVSDSQGPTKGVRFAPDGGLARLLVEEGASVHLFAGQSLPEALKREIPQLEAVSAILYLPLPQHGWIALGEKRSGEPYSTDDQDYMEALGEQTAQALDRVQLISDLERRVVELNALRWVSQAINFRVGLDDLLELIYAQTSRVLDTSSFYIALYDEVKRTLRYAFFVENEERFFPDDEWPLEMGGLHSEIIRHRQSIVTDDYMSECAQRGIAPGAKAERAWMGVPLNAGDRVIGVMNVSSPEPSVTYSPHQLQLFSAIADQAAAIIDKARLDKEMHERARQLSTLNEVGAAINSSLDFQTSLNLITEKAAEVLDAESGTLFLTDLETGELVFQVAVGPSAGDLVGLRLAPGTGIVGAAAETQHPIIVNDAQRDERWSSTTDESSGYITRALLAVPLINRAVSIGVLEILNKRDGSPFDEQDQQLLMAFASQAAVAIDNARLFTQTDQALAARVAELSMFQKIDHTLNATLDYNQVIELTLDWAVQMTGANAGVVCIVDKERGGMFIVASHGFPPEIEKYREQPWLVSEGIVGRAVRTGKPVVVSNVTTDPDYALLIPETRSQITVPLRLGEEVIGVISLECSEINGFREDDLQFVTRLADRAVVPIENAKLYAQVTRANEAKSQFVSMVAHELKNPLTNIGGYARLLELSDGPMDENKKSFVRTINANADRMRKTVEDLLDISRIERGSLKLDMETVSVTDVISETLDAERRNIEEKGLALQLSVPDDLPLVWGDRTRLVQVLDNLVSNSRKYTLEGAIHIQAQVVELPLADDGRTGKFVRCSVQDTGIGISKEDQERLFKGQFTRFDNARDVAQGHGLGLWLINRLVEMQGGRITFESELNRGSTFAFTVPVADSQPATVSGQPSAVSLKTES